MEQMDYVSLFRMAFPNEKWAFSDPANFDTLEWRGDTPKPTRADVSARMNDMVTTGRANYLLREKRNKLLKETDIYALSDYPFPDEMTRVAWRQYRQALRDIMSTATAKLTPKHELDDSGVEWPKRPRS